MFNVNYSKTTKRNATEEQLNSKNQFFAYYVGNTQDSKFHVLSGQAFFVEKGTGINKDYVKNLFTDFGKEHDLR